MNDRGNDLLEQLLRLEWLLRYRHMQMHRERGPMGDPHRGQGRILALLKLKQGISQRELSAILDIRSQSLGELLAKLERQGYISRTPSEADHRAMDISLTEAGMAAADQGAEAPDFDGLFGCLSAEEQAAFGGYLDRLIRNWEEQLKAEGGGDDLARHQGFGRRGGFPGFDRSRGPERRRPPFGMRGYAPPAPDED
ncbi:MAG TPA: MarR family transcriptional regulator [Rectinemataceae bacterium]|nr:MarR family transcriptional regulator [Rectinemataceae bacterium]